MSDHCEACGKPKRTPDQVAGKEPVGDTCTTWLLARPTKGARVVGCGLDAYRKLVAAQARIVELEALLAERDRRIEKLEAAIERMMGPGRGARGPSATTCGQELPQRLQDGDKEET